MDFREATDALFAKVTHVDLAKRLRLSIQSIAQARVTPESLCYRSPPKNWQPAVLAAAEERVTHFTDLVDRLQESMQADIGVGAPPEPDTGERAA